MIAKRFSCACLIIVDLHYSCQFESKFLTFFLVSRKATIKGGRSLQLLLQVWLPRDKGGANVSFDEEAANEAFKDEKIARTSTPQCGKKNVKSSRALPPIAAQRCAPKMSHYEVSHHVLQPH